MWPIVNPRLIKPAFCVFKSQFFQRCFKSSSISANYAWNHTRPPTENQKLFELLINGANFEPAAKGLNNLLNNSNQMDKAHILQRKIIETLEKSEDDCLSRISILLLNNSSDLLPTKAPFNSHWDFIKELDKLLVKYCKRLRKDIWSKTKFIDECLQLSVDLYKISPPTAMFYSDYLVKNILGKTNHLTIDQFLKLLYCCIICRQPMESSQVVWCQQFLSHHLDSLSLAQLSLILVAFHKTQTHLTDEHLLKRILTKVSENAISERDATLRSSLLKGINYSLLLPDSKLSEKFINGFLRLDNLSVYNYIHLCEYCVSKKFYCSELIDKSLFIMKNAVEHLREKDIERILKCATAFDHLQPPCPDIHDLIHQLDSSFSQSDPVDLDKTIPSLLRSVFLLDIYPPNMINYVLSKDWSKEMNLYRKDIHLYYWLLMTIRDCLMIERPQEYVGKLKNLDVVYKKGITNHQLRIPILKVTNYNSEKTSMNLRNFGYLHKASMDAFPDRIVRLGYLLSTSLAPDLIITTVPNHARILKGPIRTQNSFVKAYVLIYQSKQMFIDQHYRMLSGHSRLRERLLQKLGLTVINIPFYEIYHKTDESGDNTDLVEYVKRRVLKKETL